MIHDSPIPRTLPPLVLDTLQRRESPRTRLTMTLILNGSQFKLLKLTSFQTHTCNKSHAEDLQFSPSLWLLIFLTPFPGVCGSRGGGGGGIVDKSQIFLAGHRYAHPSFSFPSPSSSSAHAPGKLFCHIQRISPPPTTMLVEVLNMFPRCIEGNTRFCEMSDCVAGVSVMGVQGACMGM